MPCTFVYLNGDTVALAFADYRVEGGKTWNVYNKWSVRHDNAPVPGMQDRHVLGSWDVLDQFMDRAGFPSGPMKLGTCSLMEILQHTV